MNGKRVMKTKKTVALVALLVLLCCTVAGTVAYLVTSTDPVTNTFTPASVTTEVEEEFDGTTKSDVQIKNTGDIDAYIRAAIIINWADKQGIIQTDGKNQTKLKKIDGKPVRCVFLQLNEFQDKDGFEPTDVSQEELPFK